MSNKKLKKIELTLVEGEFNSRVTAPVHRPAQLHAIFKDIKNDAIETCIAVFLNDDLNPLAYTVISVGGQDGTDILPEEIFGRLYTLRGTYFVLIHNHPKGDPRPSDEDKKIMSILAQQAIIMNRTFLDFIIVGAEQSYWSMYEEHGGGDYTLGALV